MVRWQRFKFGWHSRVLISKTIEGKSIFMEGRAPRAEVRRDRSQMRNTGRFRVSDCPSGPRPARFAETVRLRGAAHTLSTHLERPKYFDELLRGSRAAGRRQTNFVFGKCEILGTPSKLVQRSTARTVCPYSACKY